MSTKKLNVANTLFTKVQQQVLGILFGNPDRSFYTNEIIKLTNSGTGAIQRELQRLSEVNLVTVTWQGNQKLYQANPHSYLFSDLRNIVLKTFGLADVLMESLKPISSSILYAFIYGSIAKHEDKANSDIDIMLIGDDVSYADIYPLLEKAQIRLGRQINPTYYGTKEWCHKLKSGNNFISQVLKYPKIFLIGSENELLSLE